MKIQIDGLYSKVISTRDGRDVVHFYANDLGQGRYIQTETYPSGAATLLYLEDGALPQIENGERLELLQQSDRYIERLIRAMAYLHMGVEDAANGFTIMDVEFIKRGFEIRFALDGVPAWVKVTEVATIVISKVGEKGLPSPGDFEFQGVFSGPFIGVTRVTSMGIKELLDFYDRGTYATQIHPGVMIEFLLREDIQVERPN